MIYIMSILVRFDQLLNINMFLIRITLRIYTINCQKGVKRYFLQAFPYFSFEPNLDLIPVTPFLFVWPPFVLYNQFKTVITT